MKTFEGIVVSDKMNKTVVVEVVRSIAHPLYRKVFKRSRKLKADTNNMGAVVGNRVKIVETRPISKDKNFKVLEILDKSTQSAEIEEPVKKAKDVKEEKVAKEKTRRKKE